MYSQISTYSMTCNYLYCTYLHKFNKKKVTKIPLLFIFIQFSKWSELIVIDWNKAKSGTKFFEGISVRIINRPKKSQPFQSKWNEINCYEFDPPTHVFRCQFHPSV